MQHIDSNKLYKDSSYRNEFVLSFMDFGKLSFNYVYLEDLFD